MSIITLEDYNNDSDCPELVDAYDFTYTDSLCPPTKTNETLTELNAEEMRCIAAA